ncbi:hypothetical protein SUGI_0957810 [Cryptomeria japonica]|nr:hypothetical protein SUGI_0957810 [Cryptomeria japonica]
MWSVIWCKLYVPKCTYKFILSRQEERASEALRAATVCMDYTLLSIAIALYEEDATVYRTSNKMSGYSFLWQYFATEMAQSFNCNATILTHQLNSQS